MLSPTDNENGSISLERSVPLTKETYFYRQAQLWLAVRSGINNTSKTPSVINRQDCLSPTDCQTQSIESVISISRPDFLLLTDCLTPSIKPVISSCVLPTECLIGSTDRVSFISTQALLSHADEIDLL